METKTKNRLENLEITALEDFFEKPAFDSSSDIKNYLPQNESDLEYIQKRVFKLSKEALDRIFKQEADKRNFDNTILAYDKAACFFSVFSSIISLVKNTYPDESMRIKAIEINNQFSQFAIEHFGSNRAYYQAVQEYLKLNHANEVLSEEQSYYLEDLSRDFKKAGFHLEAKAFEKVTALKKEIALLSNEFSKNINNDNSHVLFSESELEGADKDFIKQLKQKEGSYVVETDYPSYFHVMENVKSEEARRKLYLAFNNRAHPENDSVLKKVIELRHQMAQALGYENFSSYDLDGQMAKDPKTVHEFIDKLYPKVKEKAQREFAELKENLPKEVKLQSDSSFKPWDLAYISNQYKKACLSVDEKALSEFFPLESTLTGLFDIYEQFFDFEFTLKDEVLWHPDVRLMQVTQKATGQNLGYIALDLFPREGKYSHACSCAICPPLKVNGKWQSALNLVIANFTKPSKEKPSLLMFNEVNTFFHEMGHALHALSGQAQMPSLAGYYTKMDFVELPSQILEEWLWEKDILKDLSQHYETKQVVDEALLDKKILSKRFDSGRHTLRQLVLTRLSLMLFEKGDAGQVGALFEQLSREMNSEIYFEKENHFESAFGHLMGYGAKYYSYLWAKVFALDIFNEIKKKNGLLKSAEGKKYFDKILNRGGGLDPNFLMEDYLKRKPSQEAFIEDLGLDI